MFSLSHPVFQRGEVFFMSHPSFTLEESFAMIGEELRSLPDVTPQWDGPQPQKGLGALALKVQNKIFAMLVEGKLVVKLPKHRVEALIASGAGERFDPRHDGRLMKEWITVDPELEAGCLDRAREAVQFVASQR